jgi:hypothetical protein
MDGDEALPRPSVCGERGTRFVVAGRGPRDLKKDDKRTEARQHKETYETDKAIEPDGDKGKVG